MGSFLSRAVGLPVVSRLSGGEAGLVECLSQGNITMEGPGSSATLRYRKAKELQTRSDPVHQHLPSDFKNTKGVTEEPPHEKKGGRYPITV